MSSRPWFAGVVFGALALAILLVLSAGNELLARVADDAFFFYRYADNFSTGGKFSWLAEGPPEFGSTSQLFQFVVWGLRSGFPSLRETVLPLGSVCFGVLSTAVLCAIAMRRASPAAPPLLAACVVAALATQPKVFDHYTSGMETTLSIFLVGAFVLTLQSARDEHRLAIASLFVPLIYAARPEAALIPGVSVLVLLAAAGPDRWRRASVILWPLAAAFLIVIQWLACWIYYGTPLPTPFLVKSIATPYAREVVDAYRFANLSELHQLARSISIPMGLAAAAIATISVLRWREEATTWSLLLGALAFVAFCVAANRVPVTTGGARFLAPAIPVVVFLAADAAFRLADAGPYARRALGGLLAAAMALQTAPSLAPLAAGLLRPAMKCQFQCASDAQRELAIVANMRAQNKWGAEIHRFAGLPTTCVIADTEVGAIGALDWSRPILDYSGLNYLDLVRRRDAAAQLLHDRPDFIYLDRIAWSWGISPERRRELERLYAPAADRNGAHVIYRRNDSTCDLAGAGR